MNNDNIIVLSKLYNNKNEWVGCKIDGYPNKEYVTVEEVVELSYKKLLKNAHVYQNSYNKFVMKKKNSSFPDIPKIKFDPFRTCKYG